MFTNRRKIKQIGALSLIEHYGALKMMFVKIIKHNENSNFITLNEKGNIMNFINISVTTVKYISEILQSDILTF